MGMRSFQFSAMVACACIADVCVSGIDSIAVGADSTTVTLPSTKIKVTYYDFHEDGSNPEFQPVDEGVSVDTMVLPMLDADGKPQKNPAITQWKYQYTNFNNWFRPWKSGTPQMWPRPADTLYQSRADSTRPETTTTFWGTQVVVYPMIPETLYVLPDTIISDTLYKNVVVEESLQFYSTPFVASRITGVDTITHMVKVDTLAVFDSAWKFDEQLAFLPIAGKGLHANSYYIKPDWFPACSSLIMRNNCFTMEVHNTFVYKGKEMVYAGGDDDFFVYIDGEIVINQPGYHGVKPQLVMLDSLGLAKGSAHQFAMFLASRRWGNGFLIVTSIDFLQKNVGDTVMKIPAASGVIGNGYNRSAWNAAEAGGSLQMQRLDIFNAAGARVGSGEPRDFQNARGGCARMPGIYLIKAATPSGKTVPLCVIAAP